VILGIKGDYEGYQRI